MQPVSKPQEPQVVAASEVLWVVTLTLSERALGPFKGAPGTKASSRTFFWFPAL